MVGPALDAPCRLAAEPALDRAVGLAPEDRVDAYILHGPVKVNRAEHVPVIGHRDGRHLPFRYDIGDRADLASPVQQAVFGMAVQMNEVRRRHTCPKS